VRYLWRRLRSQRTTRQEDLLDGEPLSVALANADMASAKRIAVLSWDPLASESAWPRAALQSNDKTDSSQAFSGSLHQMVYLSLHPAIFDLSLQSVRKNLPFIDRIVVLTKPDAKRAIEAVAARHFCKFAVLTDDEVHRGELPSDHTARNTWLRCQLYQRDCIEANFLASDEDYLALRPLEPGYFLNGSIHTAYYFLEDMGTWLAGSPRMTCFDGGIRNTWRLLQQEKAPARSFSSHMPQIINKSACNTIFDRFVDARGPAYDEWSLYFNLASKRYPCNFRQQPYGTLGWPMRTGDWFPEVTPREPAFENYYPQNYDPVERGEFVGLEPLGDLDIKVHRTLEAFARARRAEFAGDGTHIPGVLALIVTPSTLKFVSSGTVLAGRRNVRRILLEMFLIDRMAAVVGGERLSLGEACWIPLLPPNSPGAFTIRFFASVNGARLEAKGVLRIIEDKAA
jgi:hypothetical protein